MKKKNERTHQLGNYPAFLFGTRHRAQTYISTPRSSDNYVPIKACEKKRLYYKFFDNNTPGNWLSIRMPIMKQGKQSLLFVQHTRKSLMVSEILMLAPEFIHLPKAKTWVFKIFVVILLINDMEIKVAVKRLKPGKAAWPMRLQLTTRYYEIHQLIDKIV